MKRKSHRLIRILWQTIALLMVALIGTLLLHKGYQQYYRAVYPVAYQDEVSAAAEQFGIQPSLIYAIIHTESSFKPNAVSPADAKGLMQLTNDTFQWALTRAGQTDAHSPDDLFDPSINIHYGVYVLTLLGEQFEDTETVLAAYNAGQGRVAEWLSDTRYSADGIRLHTIPYPETETYVQRVLDTQKQYIQLYSIR